MSRFWPHSSHAEDQLYSHPILHVHVLTRAIQAGTVVGAVTGSTPSLLRRLGVLSPRAVPSTFTSTFLRSAGVGSVVGLGLLSVGLPMRMRDQEEIQWQDRSWRLLENKGQVEMDDWTYPGMALGLVSAFSAGQRGLGGRGVAGRVGVGSMAGVVGYMVWRYGVKGGKWEVGG